MKVSVGLLMLAAVLAAAVGCGHASGHSTGSNTNWLTRCETDADCRTGACWCHVCSALCTATDPCASGSCRTATDVGCMEANASPMLCVAECATSADCTGQGPGLECVSGACLPTPPPGAAGAGGMGTTGGLGGMGGRMDGASGSPSAGGGLGANGGTETSGAAGVTGASANGGASSAGAGGGAGQAGSTSLNLVDVSDSRIALARYNACVVSGGAVYCWGPDEHGQLGVAPAAAAERIVKAPGLSDVAGVAVSQVHACAFTNGGDVYCWGGNGSGQVGAGDNAPLLTCAFEMSDDWPCQPTPTLVTGIARAVGLALSDDASCALIQDGTVRCWGNTAALDPWASQITSATSISLGPVGACATLTNGQLFCSADLPSMGQSLTNVRQLKLARTSDTADLRPFGCALATDGTATCFGDDSVGQLGDGAGAASGVGLSGVVELATGIAHACALLSSGEVQCWGENSYGAVGGYPLESPNCVGATCETAPRLVAGIPPLVTIAASDEQTCGLAQDDTLWCWGNVVYTGGAPMRVAGPWEAGGDVCASVLPQDSLFGGNSPCTTDDDCMAVPLDLPCDHTCDVAAVAKNDAPILQASLDDKRTTACPAAMAAGCPSPALACPDKNLRLVCAEGVCAFDDPARTGCEDHCACALERDGMTIDSICDGFHLMLYDAVTCGQCTGSSVYVVIGNRGSSPFHGSATLSFTEAGGGAPILPADRTFTLSLAAGELSDPIRIDSESGGNVNMLVSASGDCQVNQGYPEYLTWQFPSPSNPCD